MNKKSLKQLIRKNHLYRIFFPLIVTILLSIFLLINPFDYSFKPAKVSDLEKIESMYEQGHQYVSVKVEKLYYTGSDYYVSNHLSGRIYYTLINNRCYYFIIANASDQFKTVTSATMNARLIRNNSMQQSIIASMSDQLDFSSAQLESISSSVIISEYDMTHSLAIYYFYGVLLLLILSGIITLVAILKTIFPELTTPIMHLSRYGNRKTLYAIAEAEFDTATAAGRKNIYITDNFLISLSHSNVDIIPLENIVWIYKINELKKSRGRTKISRPLCIVTDCKKTFRIPHVSEHVANRIINNLQERYPEILVGLNSDSPL